MKNSLLLLIFVISPILVYGQREKHMHSIFLDCTSIQHRKFKIIVLAKQTCKIDSFINKDFFNTGHDWIVVSDTLLSLKTKELLFSTDNYPLSLTLDLADKEELSFRCHTSLYFNFNIDHFFPFTIDPNNFEEVSIENHIFKAYIFLIEGYCVLLDIPRNSPQSEIISNSYSVRDSTSLLKHFEMYFITSLAQEN